VTRIIDITEVSAWLWSRRLLGPNRRPLVTVGELAENVDHSMLSEVRWFNAEDSDIASTVLAQALAGLFADQGEAVSRWRFRRSASGGSSDWL
jgi:hypothetical protein